MKIRRIDHIGVTGVKNAKSQIVFLQAPDGQINLELSKFLHQADKSEVQESFIYSHGIQHLAFVVENIEDIIAAMKRKDYEVFVDTYDYENAYKLCYFRGPEGIIIELVEQVQK